MHPRPSKPIELRSYFAGITEYSFQTRLGVADPPLIDYLTDLLVRFVRSDAVYRARNLSGRPMTEVTEMLLEAEARIGEAKREVHQHIGDFVLFWGGIYPEALKKMLSAHSRDHLLDYCSTGKRSYHIASTIPVDETEPTATSAVLERLSRQFELCLYGLGEVRREWERRDGDDETPRPFLIN